MSRLFFAFWLTCSSLFALPMAEVLFLQSYNKGLKWTDGVSEGVMSVFKDYPHYEITTEYMDSKKIISKEYFETLLSLYRQKFQDREYKAVIVADNFAFEFALEYANELFPNTPILFCGVENYDPIEFSVYRASHDATGVVELKEPLKNFKLMQAMIPNLETIYVISDQAYSSLRIQEQILEAKEHIKGNVNVIYDNEILLETLPAKLAKLPKRSAILFTSLYRDINDRYVPYNELVEFFKLSPFPVFALTSIHLGEGIVGGIMVDPFVQGEAVARMTLRVLEGEDIENLSIQTPPATAMFDAKTMKEFGFTFGQIPPFSTIINRDVGFFEENRYLVNSVFSLSPIFLIFIIMLLIGLYKKIVLEEELKAQSDLDGVLLNNIPSAIFWKSYDGILLGCNQTLCNMLKKNKKHIIGQHVAQAIPFLNEFMRQESGEFEKNSKVTYTDNNGQTKHLSIKRERFERGVVTIITDVTETKQKEIEYKRHEQFVLQRSKQAEVGEMLASIAHQWKTPLIEISAIAQSLIYTMKKDRLTQENAKTFSDDIMNQVKYMTQTIDDFRAFIKPSTAKSIFDIDIAVKEMLQILDHTLRYNYIDIQIISQSQTPINAYGYLNEFKQTLLNIINNAKDAILEQKNREDKFIKITISQEHNRAIIEIEDSGGGISEKNIAHVFDPFYSTKENGDGFGLYMAKLIIEDKMGGKIAVSNTKHGAKFKISLEKKSPNG